MTNFDLNYVRTGKIEWAKFFFANMALMQIWQLFIILLHPVHSSVTVFSNLTIVKGSMVFSEALHVSVPLHLYFWMLVLTGPSSDKSLKVEKQCGWGREVV